MEHARAFDRAQPERNKEERLKAAIAATGAVVHEVGERNPVPEIDEARFGVLSPSAKGAMERMVESSVRYLGRSIVTDVFVDHVERREWRSKLIQDFGKESAAFLENNRLRGNAMTDVFMGAALLQRSLEREDNKLPDVERMRALITSIVAMGMPFQTFALTYDSLELEEKIAFVKELSGRLREYLALVAPKKPGIY